MDAFELLKKDHKKVSQLFKQIESASGSAKARLFTQLKTELDVHAHVEEKFLYPALENKEPAREITLEAYEEHNVVKDLLAELAAQPVSEEWDAKLTVLKENVEHHVEEEEGELFDKAEDVLNEDQIERLGAEMEAEKAAQLNGKAPGSAAKKGRKPAKKAPVKSKPAKSPGVLKRLANLVGIGTSADSAQKRAGKKAAKKTAKKSTKTAGKSAKKTYKKASAKTASKGGVARKSVKRQPASKAKKSAASTKKASKKSASKKK
jgi:hypothetical protein